MAYISTMRLITSQEIQQFFQTADADKFVQEINTILSNHPAKEAWRKISQELLTPQMPFELHLLLFSACYPKWHEFPHTAPAWISHSDVTQKTHLAECMRETNHSSVKNFQKWSASQPAAFWEYIINKLKIKFAKKPENICDLNQGVENPVWLSGAKFNIIESCFKANPEHTAIVQQKRQGELQYFTYAELNKLSNRIANSLLKLGFLPGDAIAIDMPMHYHAVAIYLGIIKMGGIVVSIADSFSQDEIAVRLRIGNAKAIFTQDIIFRNKKIISLYEKVSAANAPMAIVLSSNEKLNVTLRKQDIDWENFLENNDHFQPVLCDPATPCNILFSSGTTGDPKAIPWTHTTAIKSASDAYLHQDIHEKDILAWPTNLGWMMGPWLIFAALINQATLALYDDVPRDRDFGEFVQNAKVTMLGVVPTLVATWRQSGCMKGLDWHHIKCFSSTGECSNPEDMLYLMTLAGYKPVIEYCGGTEIGGAYISSTFLEDNFLSIFNTKAFGSDFVLLDEAGHVTNNGEVALIPPSIGLSLNLLNADHHKIYFADMPRTPDGKILRRHGDQIQQVAPDCYCILGRTDDTMNLGGIKVSSAEIERVLVGTETIIETAAIATYQQGPAHLVIFAATLENPDKETLKKIMQKKINEHLNPLFKIHDIVLVKELPKTASNKIMRRVLRKQYEQIKNA